MNSLVRFNTLLGIPAFLDTRYFIPNIKISPVFKFSLGTWFNLRNSFKDNYNLKSFFINPGIGLKYNIYRRNALFLDLSYDLKVDFIEINTTLEEFRYNVNQLKLSLGFIF